MSKPSIWRRAVNLVKGVIGYPGKRTYYAGAEGNRLYADWIAGLLSADKEINSDARRLRARARELSRNNPMIRQYLALVAQNVIGPDGIKLQAQVRNNSGNLTKPINAKIEAAWELWGRDPFVDGRMTFLQACWMISKAVETDGEVFIRLVEYFDNKSAFALQLIDPDQIDQDYNIPPRAGVNEVRMGVELNKWGRPVAYWLWTTHPSDSYGEVRDRIRVPAEQMIHHYDPERVAQTRGVTRFNAVMGSLKMSEGYVEAELVAARTGAAKMGFFKMTNPESYVAPENGSSPAPMRMDASPGTMEQLPPGYEFQSFDPQHPTSAFPAFIKSIWRLIASGLGVSYNALANDLENVNYSSIRSGLLIERDGWKCKQTLFAQKVLQPIYEKWLACSLLSGAVVLDSRDPSKFLAVKWQARGWAWVDPLKDVQASILAANNGLDSRTRLVAEKGEDFEEILEELAEEKKLIDAAGLVFTGADTVSKNPEPADPGGPENDGQNAPTDPNAQGADGGNRSKVVRLVQ